MNPIVKDIRTHIATRLSETLHNYQCIVQNFARAADEIERLEGENENQEYYVYCNSGATGGGKQGWVTGKIFRRIEGGNPRLGVTDEFIFARKFPSIAACKKFGKAVKYQGLIFKHIPL